MADESGIARPYAEAVFELARDANQLGNWSGLLHAAGRVVSDDDIRRLIGAPKTDIGALVELVIDVSREASAEDIADPVQLSNLLRLLAENGRLTALPKIAELFDKLKADVENTVNVVLSAAAPVDDETKARIAAALKRRFGREINLHFQLDENLIGGARLQADDLVIDGSVRTGLQKLASTLLN
jgi:F-type H+-transporting ATPase subunit delta